MSDNIIESARLLPGVNLNTVTRNATKMSVVDFGLDFTTPATRAHKSVAELTGLPNLSPAALSSSATVTPVRAQDHVHAARIVTGEAVPTMVVGTPEPPPKPKPKPTKVQRIWGTELGKKWTPVSDDFLENFHRLADGKLSPKDAMFIILLMKHKWDERRPFPALTTVAKSMNRTVRYVRKTCARLEALGLLKREISRTGGRSRYDLEPLFVALEELKARDAAEAASDDSTEAA